MKYTIRVKYLDREFINEVDEGQNLLDHLRALDVHLDSPCGGNGTCGKCRVKLKGGGQPSEKESKLLGRAAISKGYRLACYQKIAADMDVTIDEDYSKGIIMTTVHDIETISNPGVGIRHINIQPPTLSDQRANLNRVLDAAELECDVLDLDLIFKIDNLIDGKTTEATAVYFDSNMQDILPGKTDNIYALAVDIGTTTVAVYLVDTSAGKIIDVESFFNPQRKFGADVISRIDYVNKTRDHKLPGELLINEINKAAARIAERKNLSSDLIYSAFFAGNTTMIHLFLSLDPRRIAAAPFIPQITSAMRTDALELGLDMSRKGLVFTLPMVSGYVGADTVAAVLSSGMYKQSELSLLIDLGTNGEIVLGNSEFLSACSAAAGPAFEGANIRNGMAGVPGAIDKISIINGTVDFTVIGSKPPKGICGSAIIDIVAQLLSAGVIDDTGRFLDESESENLSPELKKRRIRTDNMEAFEIYTSEDGNDVIMITQKDIREVQNAKAAIAAGIKVLVAEKGRKITDIKKFYLAGGFGSYVDIKNAAIIGLIPAEIVNTVVSVGNAAGAGAILCAISCELYKKASELADCIEYVELSSNRRFTDFYMEEMLFG